MEAGFVAPVAGGRWVCAPGDLRCCWVGNRWWAHDQPLHDVPRSRRAVVAAMDSPWAQTAADAQAKSSSSLSSSATKGRIRRFGVISDVHVFDGDGLWRENILDFTPHRILGLANIVVMRGPGKYNTQVLARALTDMRQQGVEHLLCAGDVTNLAMECEFSLAKSLFSNFGPPKMMSFCPGNHDIYVGQQSKAQLFQQYFGQYCKSDVPVYSPRGDGFPYLQMRGGLAIIALNTGIPNTATGEVGLEQWEAARSMLRSKQGREVLKRAQFTVLVQHHPAQKPSVRGTSIIRQVGHGYKDWRELAAFSREFRVDLVVHGHLHRPYRARLADAPDTLVYESGSGTLMTEDESRVARYTVFELHKGRLARTFARVWNMRKNSFDTLNLPVPE